MIIHKKSNDKLTQGVRHIVAVTIYFLTQDVVRQFVQPHAIILPQLSYIILLMSNKKYNPKDYKDAEFITIGDGPIRVQVDKRHMRNMADYWFFAKHLFTMESDAGLIKTLAEESADK